MGRGKATLFPRTARKLQLTGEQIKLARLRRHLTAEDMAKRARISRMTVGKIEKGDPSVSIGMYLSVLNVLGMQDDILLLAGNDTVGNTYRDLELITPKRVRKKTNDKKE